MCVFVCVCVCLSVRVSVCVNVCMHARVSTMYAQRSFVMQTTFISKVSIQRS